MPTLTTAERQARIDAIRELLATGITSTTIEGLAVTISPESLRAELRRLEQEQAPATRPFARSIALGNPGM